MLPMHLLQIPLHEIFLVVSGPTYVLRELKLMHLEAAFPLFGTKMYHKLGDQWATTFLAFLTVAMAPFPYIFFIYGKKIRVYSNFAGV
jgi:hypothetical protein